MSCFFFITDKLVMTVVQSTKELPTEVNGNSRIISLALVVKIWHILHGIQCTTVHAPYKWGIIHVFLFYYTA